MRSDISFVLSESRRGSFPWCEAAGRGIVKSPRSSPPTFCLKGRRVRNSALKGGVCQYAQKWSLCGKKSGTAGALSLVSLYRETCAVIFCVRLRTDIFCFLKKKCSKIKKNINIEFR